MLKNILLFFIISITLTSCSLAVRRSAKLFHEIKSNPICYDAIIVPGVPPVNGRWDSVMKARVLWSVYLYKNNYTKNIIYSGGAVYSPYYEAKIMGLYAIELGIPAKHIYYDTLAKHSTENVYYSYKLAKLHQFKTLALATDPFQSILLQRFTKKRFTTHIAHIPIQFDTIRNMNAVSNQIQIELARKKEFISIKDEETIFSRLQGTLGKQINYGPEKKLGPL